MNIARPPDPASHEISRRNVPSNASNGETALHTMDNTATEHAHPVWTGSVLASILETAAATPHTPAVVSGTRTLTYQQLIDAAFANAAALADTDPRPGAFVLCGLFSDVTLPVAWLATMIAGKVLVPMDLHWPEARLQAVRSITDARCAIVADDDVAIAEAVGCHALTLQAPLSVHAAPAWTLSTCPRGTDLLYGFFTSGSTGTPKCALNHHAGVMNRFAYMTRRFGGGHRVYQNSAPLFDSSIWQMLWPLTSGGVTVVPAARGHWSLDAAVEVIERERITMTDFVPTLFKPLVRAMAQGVIASERLSSLRYVLIGGEAIDPLSVHAFRGMLPGARIINTYGHTEASIGMVFHEVRDADGDEIPLGQPIDNTYARIVDADLAPVPDGTFGEILVAGVCVGAGYLNAPEMTRRSFIANPFADLPGPIAYRTGDRGRVRTDGLFEYGGRFDAQVKLRGVRIELDELTLAAHEAFPALHDSCALVVDLPSGESSLALAYTADAPIPSQKLRRTLATRLPPGHVPTIYTHLAAMPTGPNGKLDRREVARQILDGLAPQPTLPSQDSPLQLIKHHFHRVLGSNALEADAHFFENGGDSLAAINLALALQDAFDRPVPAGWIYRHPTPACLLRALQGQGSSLSVCITKPTLDFKPVTAPLPHTHTLLLTGATGFVGIHLLEQLLCDTAVQILALVRDRPGVSAAQRLQQVYAAAFPGRVLPTARVRVVGGDLSSPRLGLTPAEWADLAGEVDEILHCGAEVNFLGGATSLFAANVNGTAELIRMCGEGRGKRMHHVSSLAVARIEHLSAQELADHDTLGGYEYTKYIADQLVHEAQALGLRARIYRLDEVLPALASGMPNAKSLLHLLLKSCLRHGVVTPHESSVGLLPVDAFAAWMCGFVGGDNRFGTLSACVDVTAPCQIPFEHWVRHLAEALGTPIRPVSRTQFLALLSADDDPEARLLRGMLDGSPVAASASARPHPSPRPSALHLTPGGEQFRLDLPDFSQFVDYMGRSMRTPLPAQT